MLKIKDNVDLKELEKYGFKYYENGCGTKGWSRKCDYWHNIFLNIIEEEKEFEDKKIERIIPRVYDDILYDLIKDGLVEKVD